MMRTNKNLRCDAGTARAERGFTLIESSISLAILGILLVSALRIATESTSFLADFDDEAAVQAEGHRAFTRLGDVLRKSGRMTEAGVTYPRVVAGGQELEFRLLMDVDANGWAFEEGTGNLEWNPRIFVVRLDGQGQLGVYDENDVLMYPVARFIGNVQFQTVDEDPTLHLKEVAVTFDATKALHSGDTVSFQIDGSFHLRN